MQKFGTLLFIIFCCLGTTELSAKPPINLVERELTKVRNQKLPEFMRYVEEARLFYYLGKYSQDLTRRKSYHEQGIELALKARRLKVKDPGAIFWWVANKGELAQLKNNIVALGYLKEIESALIELKDLDPEYRWCGADRVLGRIYHKAPTFVSIGSPTKAEQHFQQAKKKHGNYPGNLIFYADFLNEKGDKKEAQRLAKTVLNSPELKKHPIERHDWVQMAKNILKLPKGNTR